jgi:DNA replication ATP-dependent helicase Dna2
VARQDDVVYGIEAELKETDKPERFVLERKEGDGSVWKAWLTAEESGGRLDESLEGAVAWWPGPPKGTAAILSVVPEEALVVLRFLSESLPESGGEIRIYPVQFLEKLRTLWSNDSFASRCLEWWDNFHVRNRRTGTNVDASRFPWLRKRQKAAFYLPSWQTGFLWGPPGTGKTTTLGAVIARYLEQTSGTRVLLLSTTNSAVDQAIVAVDKAVEELTRSQLQPSWLRRQCFRIGSHFVPKYYVGREHLLPAKDFSLVQRLMELYKNEPPKQNAQEYSNWKVNLELIQKDIRKQAVDALKRARLAALTTTGAVFRVDDLMQLPPYDLVVFDEASQVSLAHALALVGLGRRVLFAGDPKQLARLFNRNTPTRGNGWGSHLSRKCPTTIPPPVFLMSSREWLSPFVT